MSKALTPRQKKLKAQFVKDRGYWSDELWDAVLRMDPDFFEAYLNFSSVPWKKGVLSPKVKELIYIAIDASTTHLHEKGTRQHIGNAFKYGATPQEIMEVLELVSALGIHTIAMGVPALVEEMKKAGKRI